MEIFWGIMGFLVIWGIIGFFTYYVATQKGYPEYWIILGFLGGIFALIAAAGLPNRGLETEPVSEVVSAQRDSMNPDSRLSWNCPDCSHSNPSYVLNCMNCHYVTPAEKR